MFSKFISLGFRCCPSYYSGW